MKKFFSPANGILKRQRHKKINGYQDQEVVDCINRCENASEGAARLVDQVTHIIVVGIQCRVKHVKSIIFLQTRLDNDLDNVK